MNTESRAGAAWGLLALVLGAPPAAGQSPGDVDQTALSLGDTTSVLASVAPQEPDRGRWRFIHVNEVETPFTTVRLGGAALIDHAAYGQNEASREHFALSPDVRFRDARFMLKGRLKTERPITWQTGIMYDTQNRKWLIRQTGFVITVPEIWGDLWIGRSKEGVSLNRIMVGYDGWTMERFTFSDASIPLLADGIRWMGYRPDRELLWNLGVFTDWLSEGQSFSYYERQVAGRLAWLRMDSAAAGNLVHLGIAARAGVPTADTLQVRSKPEANLTPYFVDTGRFRSTFAGQVGIEAYYRPASWLFGGEYYLLGARFGGAATAGDPVDDEPATPVESLLPALPGFQEEPAPPDEQAADTDYTFFHGGDAFVAWLITGETRAYATPAGIFRAVVPARSVPEGGPGAWEAILRFSFIDADSGPLRGGKFWRVSPTLNWHFSGNLRWEVGYGYGSLNRFETTGRTHFFQSRIQMQI